MRNRIISFALSIIFVIALIPLSTSVSAGELAGDINGDGKINASDYLLAKRIVLGTFDCNLKQRAAADVNTDGKNNSTDYLLVKRHVLGTYTLQQKTKRVNIALGKSYTVSSAPGANYPDSFSSELTDGVIFSDENPMYYDARFSGYSDPYVYITVDLKDKGKFINGFELHYLSINTAGVYIPSDASVAGSNDNVNFDDLGKMSIPAYVPNTTASATLTLNKEVNYRYIRFYAKRAVAWLFFDEVMIYANVIDTTPYASYEITRTYKNDIYTDTDYQNAINSVSDGTPYNPSHGMKNIAPGSSVSADKETNDPRISDDIFRLIDGKEPGMNFETDSFCGLDITEGNSVTIDLGSVKNNICGFALYTVARPAISVVLPDCVTFSVSKDGVNFVTVGKAYGNANVNSSYNYFLSTAVLLQVRYVRFSFLAKDGYIWIEEAKVFANEKEINEEDLFVYGDLDMDFSEQAVYWDPASLNYNVSQNLIKGMKAQIVSDTQLDTANYGNPSNNTSYNTPEDTPLLTDEENASSDYCYNGEWVHFYSGGGRTIFYDLGKISRVDSLEVSILNYDNWGIYPPDEVKLVLSENGKDWYLAGSVVNSSPTTKLLKNTITLSSPLRARYVAVYMSVSMHVFVDEITLTGMKNVTKAKTLSSAGLEKFTPNVTSNKGVDRYACPSEDLLGGVNDVILVYHNILTDDTDFYKPYVAYLDENGKIKDTLFDGYLYLPSTSELPSGGRAYGTSVYSDWLYLFDDMFSSYQGLSALDKTATEVKQALSLGSDWKLKVFVTIPHLDTTLTDFGDIDGDGVSEDLTVMANRVKVARLYAEKVIKKFNGSKYKNLELCGFYWFHEAISGEDATTAQKVSASLKEIDMPLFWIPYFNAAGYNRWEEFGFEVGCFQPNYAFHADVARERLYYASMYAMRYGMCIEIETDDQVFSSDLFYRKYTDYLWGGVKYGYIDAIHMYYQSGAVFYKECYSSDPKIRNLYDLTYKFIKGTLKTECAPAADYSISINGNVAYSGKLKAGGDVSALYRIVTSPAHGSITVLDNGEFVYYPNQGFKGTDTFTYAISEYFDWANPTTVTVNVK